MSKKTLLSFITKTPTGIVELAEKAGLTIHECRLQLKKLIEAGKVERWGETRGAKYARPSK